MGLEDFEKELARENSKARESKKQHHRSRDDDGERRHKHRHHHAHRHRDDSHERERRHRHKRNRDDDVDVEGRHRKRRRSTGEDTLPEKTGAEDGRAFDYEPEDGEDQWVEKEAAAAPPEDNILDQRDQDLKASKVQRDAWMTDPAAMDVEYVHSRKPKAPPSQFVGAKANHEFKARESEVNRHLKDLEKDFEDSENEDTVAADTVKDEPAQHDVSYTFGDSGSSWRMTKVRAVYRKAEESKRNVDDVALERYGDLREFDDAREEERELDRRKMYGTDYVGLEKPSGELFQERKMKAGVRREESGLQKDGANDVMEIRQGQVMEEGQPTVKTAPLNATGLNKLKAQLMKAKLRNDPNAVQLEEEYKLAEAAGLANTKQPDVIVLNNMEQRQLAGGREGELKAIANKRGRERGLVEENEDMSIEDMVKQERRSKVGSGREFAERIAKDGKFKDDLDYMDDNAANLSKKVMKSDVNLRNAAVGDFQKMQKVLSSCPLCHHEETEPPTPPIAPVVSLATRTYLSLPTEPEIAKYGAVIVPLQHRTNLLECDDDEWEELRNFMKALTRFYDSLDKGVIFYENAAFSHSKRGHAALNALPLPRHLADTAPAYFKEAILASDEQWAQHKPIIDTLALSQKAGGPGKAAFRKSMPRELPYFHVFFGLDGGYGHVVEDERRWPKGDLFAREVLGGMLDRGPETIKRQGRWERGDRRVEGFRRKWATFDWTSVLMDAPY